MAKERYANSSPLEDFVRYGAEYMKEYPGTWYHNSRESMELYILRKTRGSVNPRVIRDYVNELYDSVGIE